MTPEDEQQLHQIRINLSETNPRTIFGMVLATSLAANVFMFYRFAEVRNENVRLSDALQDEVTRNHAKRLDI